MKVDPSKTVRKGGRRPVPPPSERQRKQLERLYIKEELTVEQVARRLGTTRGRAQRMLSEAGIALRRRGPRSAAPPSGAERRRLERLYLTECLSVSEVARRLGTTRDCAEAMLIRAGIPVRRRRRSELPDPGELRRLYEEEGLTTRALADRFGVHQATLWRALQDTGAKAPRRGSWAKPRWPERIDRERLGQLYVAERLSIREVARRLGVWETTVRKALLGYGIPIEPNHPHTRRPSRQELVELYVRQGMSTKDLAQRFGVHRRTPWHWLDDAGIPRRPGAGVRLEGWAPAKSSESRPTADDRLLTSGQAAAILGVSPSTLRAWADQGIIAAQQRKPGGHRRYAAADVAELARRRGARP